MYLSLICILYFACKELWASFRSLFREPKISFSTDFMTRNTAEISHFVYTFKIWQRNLLSGSTFKTKQLSSSKQEIANKMKVKSWWPWFFEASKKRDKSKFEHQRHVLRKTSLIWYIFYFIWRRHQIILLIHGFVDGLQNLLQKFFVEILYYGSKRRFSVN